MRSRPENGLGLVAIRTVRLLTLLSMLLSLTVTSVSALSVGGQELVPPSPPYQELAAEAVERGVIPVIVGLNLEQRSFRPEGSLAVAGLNAQRRAITSTRQELLGSLAAYDVEAYARWDSVPYVALKVDAEALAQLAKSPFVSSIQEDRLSEPHLASATKHIGADATWAAGFGGSDQTVVILDTGIDGDHPFLGSGTRVVDEACFSASAGGTSLCPDGTNSQTGSGSADALTTQCMSGTVQLCDHGTHVAGIAAGQDPGGLGYDGIAPEANVIAIQVFTRFDDDADCGGDPGDAPCVRTYTADQISALNYVNNTLRASWDIAAVNMSLGGGKHTSACDGDSRKAAIDNLRSNGIATVISSGNDDWTDALASPGCISTAITVGNVFDPSDNVTDNMHPVVDVLAAGRNVDSSVPDDVYDNKSGTSMAAPQVTGAFAMLSAIAPSMSVDDIESFLETTGVLVKDSRPPCPAGTGGEPDPCTSSGYTKPRVQLDVLQLRILAGLQWLRDHQGADGSWLNDVGVTGLATLAFLNQGYDESDPDVQSAIQYILSHAHADGSIYSDSSHKTYNTSLAVLPLKATQNSNYTDEIEAARDWLVSSQWDDDCLWGSVDEDNWYWGGFGYGNHSRPDLSNSQFALLALDAADLPKSDPAWSKALTFVSRCQNRQASNDGFSPHDDGGFIYHPGSSLSPGATSYGSITGAGIWGLALAGRTPSDPRFDAALGWVTDNYTWEYNPLTDGSWGDRSLYYYYTSMSKGLSMARKTKIGGVLGIGAHDWYKELSDKLASLQRADGSWANSNSWLMENKPELATSYALLALQTRQLPKDADLELVIILHSPADLHLYDAEGRHVGKDYGTGGVDLKIPGSSYSADDPQTISVHPPVAGNYHLELVGTGEGNWEVEIIGLQDGVQVSYDSYTGSITPGTVLATGLNVGAFEGSLTIFSSEPEVAPLLEVSPTSLLMIGEPGETLRSSFVISETQGNQAVEDISIFASDLTGAEGVIAAADIELEPAGVASLPAGTSQAISVTVPLGVGLPGGTYSGTIVVESINAGSKGIDLSVGIPTPTTVDVTASPGQIAPGGENSTITAEVRDQWGNPVRDGTVVSFTTSLGTIAPATDTTVGGVASSVLTSGDTEGTATVTAVAESADGTAAVAFGLPVGGATFSHVWTSLLVPWVGLVALAGLMLMGTIVTIRKRRS